jgi:hypothetical protein
MTLVDVTVTLANTGSEQPVWLSTALSFVAEDPVFAEQRLAEEERLASV